MQKTETCKLSEKELIELAIKNHSPAIAEIIDRHKGMVFNLSFRILGSYHDAEEAAQDTFLKVFNGLARFRFECQFTTWIYSICYNTCITVKRRQNNRKDLINSNYQDNSTIEYPIGLAEQQDRNDYVNKAVNRLSPEDATIVTLFYVDEMPTSEIARIVNLTEANVRVKLHRARKQLRENLYQMLNIEAEHL